MSTVIISGSAPFGNMSNQAISRLVALKTTLRRLQSAVATASASYEGVPGTEFEMAGAGATTPNLFGVYPSDTPGEQGAAYKYAMSRLDEEWEKFWLVAEPFIEQLDNGSSSI